LLDTVEDYFMKFGMRQTNWWDTRMQGMSTHVDLCWAIFSSINKTPVSWASQQQKMVTLSTIESEYIAASIATKEAMWLHQLHRPTKKVKFNVLKETIAFLSNFSR